MEKEMYAIATGRAVGESESIEWVCIANEYIDPEFADGGVVTGFPVRELSNKKCLDSRLSDLRSDYRNLKEAGICTRSIAEAIRFIESYIEFTI